MIEFYGEAEIIYQAAWTLIWIAMGYYGYAWLHKKDVVK